MVVSVLMVPLVEFAIAEMSSQLKSSAPLLFFDSQSNARLRLPASTDKSYSAASLHAASSSASIDRCRCVLH
jgi:hypothetical protein